MRKYKVLHLTNFLDLSGQQEDTLIAAAGVNQDRFQVSLAANLAGGYGFENILAKEARAIPHLTVIDIPNLRRFPHPVYDPLALRDLYRLMKRERYDIVHTHATKAGFLGRVAARLAGVPIRIFSIHGWSFQYNGVKVNWVQALLNGYFLLLERFAARFTDKLCCLTRTLADDGIWARVGKPEQYAVTFSGINLERFRDPQVDPQKQRALLGLPPTGPIVGTITIMNRHKGVDDIVRAIPRILQEVPDAHFLLVGDGEALPGVRALVQELKLGDNVTLPGIRRDLPELLGVMDVFAHMAWFEILPRAILQALAMGTPVVVADAGSVKEIVTDGWNGYLVPPRDPAALAEKTIRILRDPELRQKMRQAARESVFKDFTFTAENMIRTTEAVYDELIDAKIEHGRKRIGAVATVRR